MRPRLLHNAGKQKTLLVVLAIWLFFLWRATQVFAPDSDYVYFNSDGAIPVLMSNDERPITVFDTYYYATDRWGGWPMILARRFHQVTGFHWSDHSLHIARTVWLFLGLWIFILMDRRTALPIMLIGLITICLHTTIRLRLFDLGQVYAWQITPLLLSWYGIRKWFERMGKVPADYREAVKQSAWSMFVFFFSFIAIWSSSASGPFLFFLIFLEAIRSDFKSKQKATTLYRLTRWLKSLRLVVLAILAELFLRINYYRYALKHYHEDFQTHMAVDFGYLGASLRAQLHEIFRFSWWPLILLSLLTVLVLSACYLYALLRQPPALLKRLENCFRDDTWIGSIGTLGIALINFVVMTVINHVRINFYDNRFLTLTFLFGSISGLLVCFLAIRMIIERFKTTRYAGLGFAGAGILFLVLAFPPKRDSAVYKVNKQTALALAEKAPGAALMGGYWETYLFAALQPEDRMLMPLPVEGQLVRMPWTKERLKEVRQIVLEYRQSKPGDLQPPPEHFQQWGNPLRLVNPNWYQNGEYVFALYANETGQPTSN